MTFCLYELTLNPDIQERLRNEIDTVLKRHGGNITYESVFEMEYLDKVVSGKSTKCSVLNRSM
jgi:cytochrome P450 family 6